MPMSVADFAAASALILGLDSTDTTAWVDLWTTDNLSIQTLARDASIIADTAKARLMFGPRSIVSAAASVDLGALSTHLANITGAGATITSLGSSATTDNPVFFVRVAGVNTLTHNATSLILPGSANIATAAGDKFVAEYLGGGNWEVWFYFRATGALVGTQPADSDLTALANNSSNGLWARTGSGTGAARTITGSSTITVSNGDGVSGNPTLSIPASVALTTPNIGAATGTSLTASSVITGGSFRFSTSTGLGLNAGGASQGSFIVGGSAVGGWYANGLFVTSGLRLSPDGSNCYLISNATNEMELVAGGVSNIRLRASVAEMKIPLLLKSYTVGTLPAASSAGAGATAFVTDALSPTWGATVVAGGSVKTPVFSDGTNWKVG